MTGNSDNLDKEWKMKDDLDNDNNKNKKQEGVTRRTILTMIQQTMMRTNSMMKYIYPYVFMTCNEDNVDEEWTMKMIWTMTTTTNNKQKVMTNRNISTMILQMMMRASNMMKHIYLYVFMTGNEDDMGEEWMTKRI